MKKCTLPLSLLIGATLTIPNLAMAGLSVTAQAGIQTSVTDNAMPTGVVNANSELSVNQSNPFELIKTQTISRASVNSANSINSNANQRALPTGIQTQQQHDMQLQIQQ